jgi:hypothetical protein
VDVARDYDEVRAQGTQALHATFGGRASLPHRRAKARVGRELREPPPGQGQQRMRCLQGAGRIDGWLEHVVRIQDHM